MDSHGTFFKISELISSVLIKKRDTKKLLSHKNTKILKGFFAEVYRTKNNKCVRSPTKASFKDLLFEGIYQLSPRYVYELKIPYN